MARITCIQKINWAIIWDPETKRHGYRRNIDVAFTGNTITYVGPDYKGPLDETVDGRRLFALPGMVTIHSHMSRDTQTKGLFEESGSLLAYDPVAGALHDFYSKFRMDPAYATSFMEYGVSELLKSGSTTIVDLVDPYPAWLEDLARSGIRAYAAPTFASARYSTPNGHRLCYEWDEASGRRKFQEALKVAEAAEHHACGRLKGMIVPAQADSCTEELFRDSADAARERGLLLQTHASQSLFEFHEMVSRHGKTPVEFLADIGFLGPTTILGHTIFIDQHPWINFSRRNDLELLASTRTTVAHCPITQTRRGKTLQSFAGYRRRGVNVGIGIDIFPHNMLEEVRCATVMAKVAEGRVHATGLGEVFEAATIGGSMGLGRDDLGRIAQGAKADLVLADLDHPAMQPVRDPLRSLVFSAAERAVRHVYVDGRRVVEDGEVLTVDQRSAAARLTEGQQRIMEDFTNLDWGHRSVDSALPLCLPRWD